MGAQLGRRRRNAVQEVCMYRGACGIQCSRYIVPLNVGTYKKSPSETVSALRRGSQNGGGKVASHMRLEVDSSKFGERSDDHMAVTCLSKAVTIHFPKGRCMIRPDTPPAPTFSRELGTPFRRFCTTPRRAARHQAMSTTGVGYLLAHALSNTYSLSK